MAKVSIVIAAYNNANLLPEVLESIFRQTYQDFEVVVVDDASTDNTGEVVGRYGARIVYERLPENRGSAAAWNRAMSLAKGEYIVLAAADDLWLPERLTRQVEILDKQPNIGLVYGRCITIDETGATLRDRASSREPAGRVFLDLFMNDNFMPASTVMFRAALLLQSGPLDESFRFCQDYDFYLRLARYTETAFVDEPLVKYRKHPGSVTTGKRERAFSYQRGVIEKIWNRFKDDPESGLTSALYRERLVKQCLKEGRYYIRHGPRDQARQVLKEALKYRPLSPVVWWYYLRAL